MESKKLLRCPFAEVVDPPLPTKGRYPKGYPEGAVVHYTAGAYGLSELELARQVGFTYFLIDKDGGIHQGFPLDRWGSHAGVSSWPSLGPGNVSKRLVGIEVDCAGVVTPDGAGNFTSWWKSRIPREEVRIVYDEENRKAGAYHIYTKEQEESLTRLILWLKENNPEVFSLDLVLGHDEVSPGRKTDPGGSLSMTMPSYRQVLRHQWALSEPRRSAADQVA